MKVEKKVLNEALRVLGKVVRQTSLLNCIGRSDSSETDPIVMLKHFGPENPDWVKKF